MLVETMNKLKVLTDAAKYDVSCASSGVAKSNKGKMGNSIAAGICHTWSADGRCVSLLKILLTNHCIYDCAYCVNRSTNDIERASFSAQEVADLTMAFYRRNYIEGLFLSSAVEVSPNHTMEKIYETLRLLREVHGFSGYIHVKAIPGADPLLIEKTGYMADRMSVNIELPSLNSLKKLAPQKNIKKLVAPMKQMQYGITRYKDERKHFHNVPKYVPGGQSTQMIIGATPDTDHDIIKTSENLYNGFELKRVYYSAYVPVNKGSNLPAVITAPPLKREHRLYQADWLLRFYHFNADEILTAKDPNLDMDFDPKIAWAFRNMDQFPVEVNQAPYKMLLRIPGIGTTSAMRIMKQRKQHTVNYDDLKKMGVVIKRAKYFITCKGAFNGLGSMDVSTIKGSLSEKKLWEQVPLTIV